MNRTPDLAITLTGLGKNYSLYNRPTDRVLDAFGLLRLFPWRKKDLRLFWALRGVSLRVQKGERLGLIGRNGAGKSTLLKLISGIVQPTEGQIIVNGSIQALMEMGTAFHPEFTGRENIHASLAYQGYSAHETAGHEEDIEDFVELGPFMDQPVKTYSAGMYARLAFAVSTAIRPDILIVDEILGAGDAYFARKCADRMKRLTQDSGATLLFVSHDISSVQQMCDRAIWIDRGQIIMDGAPLDVGKAYYAETLRLEEERLTRHNQRGSGGSLLEARPDVMIFRFAWSSDSSQQKNHPIRRLSLSSASSGRELSVLVGAPMDNDPSQPASIITGAGTQWGEAAPEHSGYMRPITASGRQAAFQFVDVGLEELDDLRLTVEHAASGDKMPTVEIYDGQSYRHLGCLTPVGSDETWHTDYFSVGVSAKKEQIPVTQPAQETIEIQETEEPSSGFRRIKQTTDKFASTCLEICEINICGKNGPQAVFDLHENFIINVELNVREALEKAWFTLAIYTHENMVVYVGHWQLGCNIKPGPLYFCITFNKPVLRQGEYILSFAVIDDYHASGFTYFSEWNRTHRIKINENYFGSIGLGAVEIITDPPCNEFVLEQFPDKGD
jgi:lipopolysaccharide transport system ATP-binding protein